VDQSVEALRIVRQRYRAGTATPTDVIDAETAATRAEQRYVSARIEYLSALARLSYVVGEESVSLTPPINPPAEDGPVMSSFEVFEPQPPKK
jgi:outer membrane protein TolC